MKSFKVSNFRLFDETGVEIELKPITVLTGANSSGKSSFVKALVAFSDYANTTLGDYRRDGVFDPVTQKLDVYRPELKLSGFSGVKNRDADKESAVTFTRTFYPTPSLFDPYIVKHSFNIPSKGSNDIMDYGQLTEINVSVSDSDFIRLSLYNGEDMDGFEVNYLNLNGKIMQDFLSFCRFCLIPYAIQENSYDPVDSSFYPEYCDENGDFSVEKTAQTEPGRLLAKIQGKDIADYRYAYVARSIPYTIKKEYKSLFTGNLRIMNFATAIDKCSELGLIFYFPVLDDLINKGKQEAIAYIKDSFKCDYISSYLGGKIKKIHFKEELNELLDDFKKSEYESFIEYFRSLENYVLENVNSEMSAIRTFNFIEDEIISRTEIAFDDFGFSQRKKEETLFSLAYRLLSVWQWEETRNYTHGSFEEGSLIRDDDEFIERYIDQRYFSYSSRHILYSAYRDYLRFVLKESLITNDFSRILYNTNSFSSVQRLHSFEENSQFVRTMKEYVQVRERIAREHKQTSRLFSRFDNGDADKKYVADSFLNKWLGKDGLNICDHIELNTKKTDGLGFMVELVSANGKKESLADLGHGITQIVSILIQIECIIMKNQLLSGAETPSAIIAMEEPEVSLHPRLQSLLADILHDAATNYGRRICFIVETHSEYLIRKIQVIASRQKDDKSQDVFAVYYFKTDGSAYDLRLNNSGRFELGFGPGFFDESASLKYDLLSNDLEHKNNPK